MATFTEHYSLIKPDEADYYDVADWNENMDTIDGLMAGAESALGRIDEKIGTPAAGGTLFSLLEGGGGLIKSLQTVDLSMQANGSTDSKTIQTVDPSRCLVTLIQLNTLNGLSMDFTLSADSISASATHNSSTNIAKLRFQIIEFY